MRTLPHKWQDFWLVLDCIFESLHEENFSVSEGATRDQAQEIILGSIYYYSDTVISLPGPRLSG